VRGAPLAVALLLALPACRHAGLGSGEVQWWRVRTPHFVVHSDLDEPIARERAELLERLLAAYLQHGWDYHGELPLQLNVVLFAHPAEFDALTCKRDLTGYFTEALFEPWMVQGDGRRSASLTTLRHELSHYLAFMAMQYQPPWFAEGIASYFETAYFDDEIGFVVGKVPLGHLQVLQQGGRLSAEQLLSEGVAPSGPDFYASAWLLVHYLMSAREPDFTRYQLALSQGKGHRAAWSEALPDLTYERIDQLLVQYVRAGEYANYARPVGLPPASARSERLSRADEYALRGLLYKQNASCSREHEQRSRESLVQALALAPHQLEASALVALARAEHGGDRLADARALSERHPGAWLSWLTLASVAHAEGERATATEAVQRSLELAPRQPYAIMLAAQLAMEEGERAQALHASARALRIQPTNMRLLLQRALILAALGECQALHDTAATLSTLAHGGLTEAQRASWAKLSTACAERAASTPDPVVPSLRSAPSPDVARDSE